MSISLYRRGADVLRRIEQKSRIPIPGCEVSAALPMSVCFNDRRNRKCPNLEQTRIGTQAKLLLEFVDLEILLGNIDAADNGGGLDANNYSCPIGRCR